MQLFLVYIIGCRAKYPSFFSNRMNSFKCTITQNQQFQASQSDRPSDDDWWFCFSHLLGSTLFGGLALVVVVVVAIATEVLLEMLAAMTLLNASVLVFIPPVELLVPAQHWLYRCRLNLISEIQYLVWWQWLSCKYSITAGYRVRDITILTTQGKWHFHKNSIYVGIIVLYNPTPKMFMWLGSRYVQYLEKQLHVGTYVDVGTYLLHGARRPPVRTRWARRSTMTWTMEDHVAHTDGNDGHHGIDPLVPLDRIAYGCIVPCQEEGRGGGNRGGSGIWTRCCYR